MFQNIAIFPYKYDFDTRFLDLFNQSEVQGEIRIEKKNVCGMVKIYSSNCFSSNC